jgi:hypothetical protein
MTAVLSQAIDQEMVTCDEAATILHLKKNHLAQLRHRGTGPKFFKPTPRTVLYLVSDLYAWLEASECTSTVEAAQQEVELFEADVTTEEEMIDDCKSPLKSEYFELKERTSKLRGTLHKWTMGQLDSRPACSFDLLSTQLRVMEAYESILAVFAQIEHIDLQEE